MSKVAVHKLTVLVIDFDELGASGVAEMISHVRYPNHCISPDVLNTQTAEVEWSDDCPLNKQESRDAELERLFA